MNPLVKYYSGKFIIEITNIPEHDVKKLGTTWYEGVDGEFKETATVTIS